MLSHVIFKCIWVVKSKWYQMWYVIKWYHCDITCDLQVYLSCEIKVVSDVICSFVISMWYHMWYSNVSLLVISRRYHMWNVTKLYHNDITCDVQVYLCCDIKVISHEKTHWVISHVILQCISLSDITVIAHVIFKCIGDVVSKWLHMRNLTQPWSAD